MRARFPGDRLVILPEVGSTQAYVAELLIADSNSRVPAVVIAQHQSSGRGRFGRKWVSRSGESLTMSLVMRAYADHPKPWLVGMGVAIAAGMAVDCRLRWPNDLVIGEKKVGGILTEIFPDALGRRIPVVGIGINVNQRRFGKNLESIATSLFIERGEVAKPLDLARKILVRLHGIPDPSEWADLWPRWRRRDATKGRRYLLPDGRIGIAKRIGPHGELVCGVGGEEESVLAAEAILGDEG